LILQNLQEAKNELTKMLGGKFGNASKTVVIEQFLEGIEMSAFVLTDGKSYKILPEAKDYKRVGEGDTGLNTGGMGAVSPVPFANMEFLQKVEERIIRRTIDGLINDRISHRGFIFFGLMNVSGDPYLIEYNVRLGDPESEVVLPRINSDLLELFKATADGKLEQADMQIDSRFVTTVMLVSGGYPGDYIKGLEIHGLDKIKNSIAFHAGTKFEHDRVNTNGGRVLAISSYGQTMNEALDLSYTNANLVHFRDMYYRKDIGFDLR
jgi:phosphoribosylamine---glycine ligase